MILLIDADYMAYRVAAGCQEKIKWDDNVITSFINMEQAKNVFSAAVFDACEVAGADPLDDDPDAFRVVLCWSCPTRRYHRHDIAVSYKSGRNGDPPLGLRDLREWAEAEWPSYTRPGLEADDILGILASRPALLCSVTGVERSRIGDERIVVVGVDKDLLQIPGWHINPNEPERGIFMVSSASAAMQLYTQALTGDATDGYGGCPGMGPVRAQQWLERHGYNWEAVAMAFQKAGLTPQDAADQFNLARILSGETYDFDKKQPILWTLSATRGETA